MGDCMKHRIHRSNLIYIKTLVLFLVCILSSDSYIPITEDDRVKILYFSGSPYEIGFQKAIAYCDEISGWNGTSLKLFEGANGAVLKLAFYFQLTRIREKSPGFLSEWQGIADGAAIPFEDVAVKRIGTRTLKNIAGLGVKNEYSSVIGDIGCSIFAMTHSDRGPILVNTGDGHSFPQNPKVYVIEKEAALNQYSVIRCKGAGVNEMGLAAGGANAHYSGRDILPDGPASDLSKEVLRYCPDVDSAVNFIRNYQISGDGWHFALVDTSGEAAAVEKGPEGLFNVRWADSTGYVFATNTSPDSFLRAHCTSDLDYMLNSDNRYANFQRLFTDPGFTFTFTSAEKITFNHDSIGAICQHGDVYPGQWYTTRTRLMLPQENKIMLAAKTSAEQQTWRPCECGWIEDTISTVSTSISRQTPALPRFHQLEQNYPNPFNSQTTISYELAENSTIELAIFNQLGQKIKTLADGFQSIGRYAVAWDGKNKIGNEAASGTYYYQLKADDYILVKRMILYK